jgi:hypothetical protein
LVWDTVMPQCRRRRKLQSRDGCHRDFHDTFQVRLLHTASQFVPLSPGRTEGGMVILCIQIVDCPSIFLPLTLVTISDSAFLLRSLPVCSSLIHDTLIIPFCGSHALSHLQAPVHPFLLSVNAFSSWLITTTWYYAFQNEQSRTQGCLLIHSFTPWLNVSAAKTKTNRHHLCPRVLTFHGIRPFRCGNLSCAA